MPSGVRSVRRAALDRWAPPLALAAGLTSLVAFGMVGVARHGLWAMDFEVFHAAGRTWLAGESPYDRASLDRHFPRQDPYLPAFASPPAAAPFFMGLALMSEGAAMKLLDILGLAAVGALGWITAQMAREPITPGLPPASAKVFWYFPALFAFSTFTFQTVWLGQVSLITVTALQAAWYLDRKRRPIAGGLCLALAGLKPQILMLPLVWFLLEKRWRMILVSGLAAGLLMAYPLLRGGPIAEMKAWMAAVRDYKTHAPNQLGSCFVVGLPSLVAAAGGPALDLTLLGIALTAIVWWFRRRICEDDVPALLAMITLGIVYGHDLDFVYLAPLAVSLTLHLRGRLLAGLLVAVLLALFFIPSRLICQFGHPVVDQWRTVICLVFLGWLVWLSVRHAAVQAGAAGLLVS
jgi:Glycosyltransferase family 87